MCIRDSEAGFHLDAAVRQLTPHDRRVAHVAQPYPRAFHDAQRLNAVLPGIVLGLQHRGGKILAQFALRLGLSLIHI